MPRQFVDVRKARTTPLLQMCPLLRLPSNVGPIPSSESPIGTQADLHTGPSLACDDTTLHCVLRHTVRQHRQLQVQQSFIRAGRKIGKCRPVPKFPFFQPASSAGKMHQRNLRERWRGCGKVGKMGLGKMGILSQIVPIFSDFPPVSYQFHKIFSTLPTMYFWQFPKIPQILPFPLIFPHSPPFSPIPPIFPFSTFSFTSATSWPIQLWLMPVPEQCQACMQATSCHIPALCKQTLSFLSHAISFIWCHEATQQYVRNRHVQCPTHHA